MKKDNGITLIALVITIIVMLILVIVTVSFAMNGGLFTNAREASSGYRAGQITEAISIVKGEIYADYYSQKLSANDIKKENCKEVLDRVNDYLAGSGLDVTKTSASIVDGKLTVKFDTSKDVVDKPENGWEMVIDFITSL